MKIVVAILTSLIALPILFMTFFGSVSLFANTGNPTGFLINAFLVFVLGFIWWGALRENARNQTSWTLVLALAAVGLALWFYGVDILERVNTMLG